MVMRQRSRARTNREGCDCCNSNLTNASKYRRTVKRRERAAWKREAQA